MPATAMKGVLNSSLSGKALISLPYTSVEAGLLFSTFKVFEPPATNKFSVVNLKVCILSEQFFQGRGFETLPQMYEKYPSIWTKKKLIGPEKSPSENARYLLNQAKLTRIRGPIKLIRMLICFSRMMLVMTLKRMRKMNKESTIDILVNLVYFLIIKIELSNINTFHIQPMMWMMYEENCFYRIKVFAKIT